MTAFNSRLKSLCDDHESWLCVGLDMNPEAFGSNDLANLKDHTFNVIDALYLAPIIISGIMVGDESNRKEAPSVLDPSPVILISSA